MDFQSKSQFSTEKFRFMQKRKVQGSEEKGLAEPESKKTVYNSFMITLEEL